MKYLLFSLLTFVYLFSQENTIVLDQKEKEFIQNNPTITLGVDATWAPYVLTENGKVTAGYTYEMVQKINAIAKINIQLLPAVWSSLVKSAKKGDIEGLAVSVVSSKRAKYFDFTNPTAIIRKNIIVRDGNPKNINSLKDLEHKTIAIQKDNGYQRNRVSQIKDAKIVEFKDYTYFDKFLVDNKVDAIPMSDASLYTLKALNIPFNKVLYLEDDNRMAIVFSINKKYPELTSIVNKSLALIPKQEIEKLKQKWFYSSMVYDDEKKENAIGLNEKEQNTINKKPRVVIGIGKELTDKDKSINEKTLDISDKIYKLSGLRVDFKVASEKNLFNDMKLKKIDGIVSSKQNCKKNANFLCSENLIYDGELNYNFTLLKEHKELLSIINKSLYNLYTQTNSKSFLTTQEKQYLYKNNTIRYCIDPFSPPLEELRDGKHIGVGADILKILSKSTETSFELVKTKSWSESLSFIKEKKCDILPLTGKSKKRQEYIAFSDMAYAYTIVLVTKNNVSFVNNIKDLENRKIGIRKDYAINENIKEKYPNLTIVSVKDNVDGMNRVQNGELFALVGSLPNLGYLIQEKYLGKLKISGTIDDKSSLFIGISKDKEILLEILNKALKEIPVDVKQNIMTKWSTFIYEDNLKYLTILKIVIGILCLIFLILLFFVYREFLLKKHNQILKDAVEKEREENKLHTSKMLQQSKLIQVGEMTNIIAHQWRQPLSAISATTNNLMFKLALEDHINKQKLIHELELISNYSQHLSKTISDFRSFFKSDKELSDVNLKELIDKTIEIINPTLKEYNIILDLCSETDIYFKTYKNEIQQALLCIIQNAYDAIIENNILDGKVIITTNKINKYINIKVSDNAGGISESVIEKVFDSYFTTKKKQGGTGIGLYISKIIIESHCEGKLKVYNQANGVVFDIFLPMK